MLLFDCISQREIELKNIDIRGMKPEELKELANRIR